LLALSLTHMSSVSNLHRFKGLRHRVQDERETQDEFDEKMKGLRKCDLPKTEQLLMHAHRKTEERRKQFFLLCEEEKEEWEKDEALSDKDLRGVKLRGADISQLDLSRADCRGAFFV
jgi:uncharacterized protein YjbI with pentapeptide repeats